MLKKSYSKPNSLFAETERVVIDGDYSRIVLTRGACVKKENT